MSLFERLRKFSIKDKQRKPIEERIEDQKEARKNTPKVQSFGDGLEMKIPIAFCKYCSEPMFEIRAFSNGDSVASCATPGCMGNQDTPEIYVTAKRKMDDKFELRGTCWVR